MNSDLSRRHFLKHPTLAAGLTLALPEKKVGDYAYGFKIDGRGLTAKTA